MRFSLNAVGGLVPEVADLERCDLGLQLKR